MIPEQTLLAFDLDDTLLHETDYIRGVIRAIASEFNQLPIPEGIDIKKPYEIMERWAAGDTTVHARMVEIYRTAQGVSPFSSHLPDLLDKLKRQGYTLAVITDGFTLRQRAKLRLLGIESLFDEIWISEERCADKLSGQPFEVIMKRFPRLTHFVYIGDNPAKDFAPARSHGWHTVMLRATTENIHPQSSGTPADITIDSLHSLTDSSLFSELYR